MARHVYMVCRIEFALNLSRLHNGLWVFKPGYWGYLITTSEKETIQHFVYHCLTLGYVKGGILGHMSAKNDFRKIN